MTNIDQFESVFRSADKEQFAFQDFDLRKILVISDATDGTGEQMKQVSQAFLGGAPVLRNASWELLDGDGYGSVAGMMKEVVEQKPDMIVTYRNLKVPASDFPFSLGTYVDVLTQATAVPVLVLPRPEEFPWKPDETGPVDSVMAVTDHLTGDHVLVSFAARLTEPAGTLFLAHVEDRSVLKTYLAAIGKLPSLDTEVAEQDLPQQLLKEPLDYIESCRKVLMEAGLSVAIEAFVTLGHQLGDYRRMIDERNVDLLVMNTKDDDQMAMHGLAYPLAVELRKTPMVLL